MNRNNIVKVTGFKTEEQFYVNLDHVTHLYRHTPTFDRYNKETRKTDKIPKETRTVIVFQGLSSGNPEVLETPEEILQMLY